ncbi:MAG: type 3 dihydrofolate reductase [Woeseiaceae bacterium]
MISIIVAASTNSVIGAGGDLPWKISDDLKRFKRLTLGKPVIMGRRTWDSIGRPLPGRQNIVVTRQADFQAEGCEVVASPADALRAAGDVDEIVVIGGSEIYALFLPKASRIYLTRVQARVEGDAYFPDPDDQDWQLVDTESHAASDANQYAFEFRTYERKGRF